MDRVKFGRTGFDVSRIGFGGAEIGVLGTTQEEANTLLNGLLDRGVNLIDTAAMYRVSETLIGNAIAGRRDEFVLVSKCGTEVDDIDAPAWSAELVSKTVDRALNSLQTGHLDVMLLHSCDLDVLQKGDGLGALIAARDAGKIRHVGYSGDNDAGAWAAAQDDIAVIETSVNICDQVNIDRVLPVCVEHEVGVLAKRPVANAAWKQLDDQPGGYKNYAAEYTKRLQAMGIDSPRDVGFESDDWAAMALRFTLSQPGVHCAIVGTTNPKHVAANIAAADAGPLDASVVEKLRDTFNSAHAATDEAWTGQT